MRLAVVAALVAGCYDPDVPFGVPCSDTGECPAGQECDQATRVCNTPTELRTWREDTAADFAGGTARDAIVERAGFVGPIAYAHGRVRLAGVDGDRIVKDPAAATWASVSSGAAGVGFSKDMSLDFGMLAPDGLGMTAVDNLTVLIEGEVELDVVGPWGFELNANDSGFFEIAAPGGDFVRVVNDIDVGTVATYDVFAPGWFRFRAAFSDANQFVNFTLRYDPPNVAGSFRTIPSARLRCRVDDLSGYLADGFEEGFLVGYTSSTLVTVPLELSLDANPYGLQIGMTTWSMRFAGQVLIDVEGDYAFSIASREGHRAWIDGMQIANKFTSNDQMSDTAPVRLTPGWHDLVVDVTKSGNDAPVLLSMKVSSGPAWQNQPIPVDHIRPVIGRVARWSAASATADLPIPDNATATRTLFVELPTGASPMSVDATHEVDHPVLSQVSVVLDPPAGANITLLSAGAASGSGARGGHAVLSPSFAGTTWNFIVGDNLADAMTGNLTYAGVTVIYTGGGVPFPTSYRYESAVKDLGNVVGFGALTWTSRQGDVRVQFRTCDVACTTEPWLDVSKGAVPAATAKQFAQYAVDFTSDGNVPTAFDSFELSYTARP